MARLFGTDGVRGVANTQLTCDLAFKLGQAAVAFQGKTVLVGKDTRLSGDMLESAVAAGIMSMGGTALLAGIIPTPAIALLVRELACDGGIVISASHNPPEYNGIKLTLEYEVTDEKTGMVHCRGLTKHCFLNEKGRPVSLKKDYPDIHALFVEMMEQGKQKPE